jgi:DNA-binding MarR family transcriptional regulator
MDTLQEVPLSAVLKERVALIQQKYDMVVSENATLKRQVRALEADLSALHSQIPSKQGGDGELDPDTARVLAYLFRAEGDDRDIGIMARALGMEKGVAKYHLDRLKEAGLGSPAGGNYISGHSYWALTPEGRRYAVEKKLI